jgi:hypothetical protein
MLFVQFRRIWFCLGRHRQLPPRDVSRCHAGPLLVSRAILSALPWAGRRRWVIVAGVGSGLANSEVIKLMKCRTS